MITKLLATSAFLFVVSTVISYRLSSIKDQVESDTHGRISVIVNLTVLGSFLTFVACVILEIWL